MQTIVPMAQASPSRWTMPPPRLGFNPPQGFQNRPSFPIHQFQPRMPAQQQNNQSMQIVNELDAKRPVKKSTARKTVDYNAAILRYLEARVWQRAHGDRRAVQPDSIYYAEITPPQSMLENPTNAVTTKFVRTSTNKMRCPIFCCVWTPEGRRLITGASSGEFTLWNGLTFNFETILQAHDCSVRSMVWSHNDLWMVTGDHAGFVKYWQSNMNNVKMFQAHKEAIRGISFCPTDTKLVTCSDDGTVRVMDFLHCYEEKILRGHGADVKSVDWHPQKGLIVSGSKDSQQPIKLWDPRTGQSLATIHFHKSTVMCTKWNQNGNWLLTGSRDHLLKIFDIRNLSQEVQTFRGHKKEVCSVAWHPQHETLFTSGGSDGSIMFWDVGTDKEVGSMEQAHDGIVWSLSWHPLGHILCSGSNDHTSKFWTRNRPGDKMRDKYNLNTLPKGVDESFEYDEPTPATAAAPQLIPGMGLEQSLLEKLKPEPALMEQFIPGLDFNIDDSLPAKKVPFAKPIPKSFQQQWMENKRPVSLLPAPGQKLEPDSENQPVQETQVPSDNLNQHNPSSGMPPPDKMSKQRLSSADNTPGANKSSWNKPNGSETRGRFQQGQHNQRSNFRNRQQSQNFNYSGGKQFSQQFDKNRERSPENWHGSNMDQDDRMLNTPSNMMSRGNKDQMVNKSGKNQRFDNSPWQESYGDKDDRVFLGQNTNNFGDSDLRTINQPPQKNRDKDERQSRQQPRIQFNVRNNSDVDERLWGSNNDNYNNEPAPEYGRKRLWNDGPGSNNNFNPDMQHHNKSRGRARGGRGRGRSMRGRNR